MKAARQIDRMEFRISPDLKKAFRITAFENDQECADIIRACIRDYVRVHCKAGTLKRIGMERPS